MFSRMGSVAFKKDLDNIRLLCEALGNPHHQFKSIHVGGTNGKGSVSHMLTSAFQTSGYKTGLYTSPHLYDFRERIKINGKMVEESFVVDFVSALKPLIEKIQPSFFEITVAMAFQYFAINKIDIAIIEVGLGGRLDSTNIITPELSVITNIGWDHMNMLGNSLEEIAIEKAGIIKPNIPVVIGERQPLIDNIFIEHANKIYSDISFASDEWEAVNSRWENELQEIEIRIKRENRIECWQTDLLGIYQKQNLCTVLEAMHVLVKNKNCNISEDDLKKAICNVKQNTGLMGRWEVIYKQPIVVLEVAHNVNGIEQMLAHVKQTSYNKLHVIIGMAKDKDIKNVIALLPTDAEYYFTQASMPRAMDVHLLKQIAGEYSLHGDTYLNVNQALEKAMTVANPDDLIIVCGSIFLVADVDRKSISKIA